MAELPDVMLRRLALYEDLLRKWQSSINLIARSTLDDIWIRHFVDSLQVSSAAPQARRWVDLGSGGGFPGLVTAIRYADDPNAETHLIESDQRKCAFLRTVSRETGAGAIVHCGRIENIAPKLDAPFDAVSARALAPLPELLRYAEKFLEKGAVGVFSKGEQIEAELTGISAAANYQIASVASETSDSARLILVRRRVE
ncbi:16S rRNA (guanine(527)-N(7))-methyltransferase RsmG [Methylocella silvestris]|uniref:16S rRNA (guanine(527)-N(7))-methyltransferase RsmG n=1 Tax=Methylocella silvestris TaxID=199596 RepID=UPI001FDF0DFC|nr:16S rRNA (guanine(527)-N(7))-methyltransferase RsmG [Methylocella silvestris]